jgi:hypothetical protein
MGEKGREGKGKEKEERENKGKLAAFLEGGGETWLKKNT